MALDPGREPKQARHLGEAGTGDSFWPGHLSLVGDRPRFEEVLPLHGLPEKSNYSGRPGKPGWAGFGSAGRDGTHDPTGGHTARQGANAGIVERPRGPEGDLDRLVAELGNRNAVAAILGNVENPEPDLRLRGAMGSKTVTFGEPDKNRGISAFVRLTKSPESESPWGFFLSRSPSRLSRLSGPGPHVLCFESVRLGSDGKPHLYDRTPKNRAKTLRVSG